MTGRWLPSPRSTVDVQELSATLNSEVQYFASYRVGEVHRWERAINGILLRSFGFVGEVGEITDWRGDPDGTELAYRRRCRPRSTTTPTYWSRQSPT